MTARSDVLGVLTTLCLGSAVSILIWGLGRCMIARKGPLSLRGIADPVLASLGRWLLAVLPDSTHSVQARLLARADLDARMGVELWMGLRAAILIAAMALAALVAASGVDGAMWYLPVALALSAAVPEWFLRRRLGERERLILKELPAYLDVLTVCVEAGATLSIALRIAVEKAPPSSTRSVFERLLREIRIGRSRVESLTHVARLYGIEGLTALCEALVQSEGHGMSLGNVLRAQAQQRATERQLKAEKAALKAPVKMLGPLILCIFPCTFIVIAVPVVVRMFMEAR